MPSNDFGDTLDKAEGKLVVEQCALLAESVGSAMETAVADASRAAGDNPDPAVLHQLLQLFAAAKAASAQASAHRSMLRLAAKLDEEGTDYRFVRPNGLDLKLVTSSDVASRLRREGTAGSPDQTLPLGVVARATNAAPLPGVVNPDDLSEVKQYLTDPLGWVFDANRNLRRDRAIMMPSEVIEALYLDAQMCRTVQPINPADDPVGAVRWLWANHQTLDDAEFEDTFTTLNQTSRVIVGRASALADRAHQAAKRQHLARLTGSKND